MFRRPGKEVFDLTVSHFPKTWRQTARQFKFEHPILQRLLVFKSHGVPIDDHAHVGVGGDDDQSGVNLLPGLAFLVDLHRRAPLPHGLGGLHDLGRHLALLPLNHHLVHAVVEGKILIGPADAAIEGHGMDNSLCDVGFAGGQRSKEPDGVPLAKLFWHHRSRMELAQATSQPFI